MDPLTVDPLAADPFTVNPLTDSDWTDLALDALTAFTFNFTDTLGLAFEGATMRRDPAFGGALLFNEVLTRDDDLDECSAPPIDRLDWFDALANGGFLVDIGTLDE